MNQKNSLTKLQKQLKILEDEDKSIQNFSENYKKKFSEELKKMDPKEIKNTILVEKKYTLWQRILKTLGIN
jgi:hypothetical protein